MYNEHKARVELAGLSLNARNHVSHVLRNELQLILAAAKGREDVEAAIVRMDGKIRELGF